MYIAIDGKAQGVIAVSDAIKETSKSAVHDSFDGMALAGTGSRLQITSRKGPLVWVWTFLGSGPVIGFFLGTNDGWVAKTLRNARIDPNGSVPAQGH